MMRSLLLASLLFSAAAPALAADTPESPCPRLPAKSGVAWKVDKGADFVVCRGMRGKSQLFGIYLGGSPSYLHQDKNKAETGKVGPYDVTWYNAAPDDTRGEFAREALIRFGEKDSDGVAHVWISAANADEFAAAAKVLEGLTFKSAPAAEKAAAPEPAQPASAD